MARVRTEERRNHIIACATEIFEELGFQSTTMDEIASRASLTKRAVYGYFPSKEELFSAVIVDSIGLVSEREQSLAELRDDALLEPALTAFGTKYLAFVLSEAEMVRRRLLVEAARRGTTGPHIFKRGPKQAWDRIAAFIALRMKGGELRVADADVAAVQLLALLKSEQFQLRLEGALVGPVGKATIRANVQAAVDTFLRAYAPPVPPLAPAPARPAVAAGRAPRRAA